MVNGKKYPYTKAGMNAAKKAAAKKKPMQKRPGMTRDRNMMNRKPGRMR